MRLDPVSALLADEAGPALAQAPGAPVVVLDDTALARALSVEGHQVRAWCDDVRDEALLAGPGLDSLDSAAFAGVQVVLARLPKSLGQLEDYAQRVAAFAGPDVQFLAGGREKHLNRGMNEVLAASFGEVRASLGRQKSRVLHARQPLPGPLTWPKQARVGDLTVVSHAGSFAAGRLDGGTRLLLECLEDAVPRTAPDAGPSATAIDLGCGTGILATWLARRGYQVVAVDVSRAACASTSDTAAANGVSATVLRSDGLPAQDATQADMVVCNPPFHRGTTKDSTPGFGLLRSARPALAPGGTVWTVFNSHLPYLPFLRAEFGPTRIAARDRHYTVTLTEVADPRR